MSNVAAYVMPGNGLAQRVVPLMVHGAVACGDNVTLMSSVDYKDEHLQKYDAAIFWGYVESCQAIMRGYNAAGKSAVYLDLGYWMRGNYYKVSVGDRHPTAYFQRQVHDDVRRKMFGIEPKPYSKGKHILVAGMGAKAAWAEKVEPVGSWEESAIFEIKNHTDRPIIYRPKPSWTGAVPLAGAGYSSPKSPLEPVLRDAFAVVAHHSNVVIDGLVAGVPAFVWKGVGVPMGLQDLSKIDNPSYPYERELWLNNVAYCQWSDAEMRDGTCWRYLKHEGLVL